MTSVAEEKERASDEARVDRRNPMACYHIADDKEKVMNNYLHPMWCPKCAKVGKCYEDSIIPKCYEPQNDLLVTEYPQDGEVSLIFGRDKTEAVVMAYDVYKELTEPQTDCLTCRYNSDEWDSPKCDGCSKAHSNYEPQTERSE